MSDEAELSYRSESRTKKIETGLRFRQPTLSVIMENIHDPHNFNAILRSMDAVGAMTLSMLYTIEKPPRLLHTSSSGAYKWIDVEEYNDPGACITAYHDRGFRILAAKIEPDAKSLYTFDLTVPTVFVLGNEHRGVSEQLSAGSDEIVYVPMRGMSESLNVSVAAAVMLFEAMRQRERLGMYEEPQLSTEALRSKTLDWLTR